MDDAKMPMPEPDETSEFEKFEKLARRLVRIPKSEIDVRREKERKPRGAPSTT